MTEYYSQPEEVIIKMKTYLSARARGQKQLQDKQMADAKSQQKR